MRAVAMHRFVAPARDTTKDEQKQHKTETETETETRSLERRRGVRLTSKEIMAMWAGPGGE